MKNNKSKFDSKPHQFVSKQNLANVQSFVVDEGSCKMRLDVFVQQKLPTLTRSYVKTLIDDGKIEVDDKVVKAGFLLKSGSKITIDLPPPQPSHILPENIAIDIVYEDDDVLVVNKPQGMVVHPAGKLKTGTLVNALLFHAKNLSSIGGVVRPGIVHRIDKDTSGLLVVAKNNHAHIELQKQIQSKTCKRIYLAVCYGSFKMTEGEIQTYLARGKTAHEKIFVVPQNQGRFAHTLFKVVSQSGAFSLVQFELKTGRTHQIRVHASHIGHPIVGDKLYGKKGESFGLDGQLLHAQTLMFEHPTTHKKMSFSCPLPSYFENFLKAKKLSL